MSFTPVNHWALATVTEEGDDDDQCSPSNPLDFTTCTRQNRLAPQNDVAQAQSHGVNARILQSSLEDRPSVALQSCSWRRDLILSCATNTGQKLANKKEDAHRDRRSPATTQSITLTQDQVLLKKLVHRVLHKQLKQHFREKFKVFQPADDISESRRRTSRKLNVLNGAKIPQRIRSKPSTNCQALVVLQSQLGDLESKQ